MTACKQKHIPTLHTCDQLPSQRRQILQEYFKGQVVSNPRLRGLRKVRRQHYIIQVILPFTVLPFHA